MSQYRLVRAKLNAQMQTDQNYVQVAEWDGGVGILPVSDKASDDVRESLPLVPSRATMGKRGTFLTIAGGLGVDQYHHYYLKFLAYVH